ncbi:MAG: hypothetical protein ACTHOG_11235 [Marmoricola sp.]
MKSTKRRRFRMGAAALAAVSLVGLQVVSSGAAHATGTTTFTTWMPSSAPALWSDGNCTSNGAAPSNTPSTPPTDAQHLSGTQTYVSDTGAHSRGATDVGWNYAPAASTQGGPVVTIPTSTTAMSVDVQGATSGRLMVLYDMTSNNQTVNYVGVWNFTTAAGWNTVTAGDLTWYYWQPGNPLTPGSWQPANVPFLQSQNVPESLSTFFNGKSGTARAAFELGCTGAFAFDHLRVTAAGNITDYDVQTPTSSTTATQGATSVPYGSSTTITPRTQTSDGGVTIVNPAGLNTLEKSVAGGAWTVDQTAAPGTVFTVAPTKATQYRVLYASSTLDPLPSTSNVLSVAVKPGLRLSATASKINVGKADTFHAALQPAAPNVTVTFQQLSGTTWTTLGSAATNTSGVATLVKARATTGVWKVRSVVAARTGYLATTSNTISVGVYQPVSITAYRTWSTVYVGRYLRIYGAVTPHVANIPLQFQQYTGGRWVVVATGRSGTKGSYAFTKLARTVGTATFRVVAPASGYRKLGVSPIVKVSIVRAPVSAPPPPPPPPPSGGGGGGGSGIG